MQVIFYCLYVILKEDFKTVFRTCKQSQKIKISKDKLSLLDFGKVLHLYCQTLRKQYWEQNLD